MDDDNQVVGIILDEVCQIRKELKQFTDCYHNNRVEELKSLHLELAARDKRINKIESEVKKTSTIFGFIGGLIQLVVTIIIGLVSKIISF